MLLCKSARSLCNLMTVGLASASAWRIASASASHQSILLIPDLVSQGAERVTGVGQTSQRFGTGVAIGQETVAKSAKKGQGLLQETLDAGPRAKACSSARARRQRHRGISSRRRSPGPRGPRLGVFAGEVSVCRIEFAVSECELISGLCQNDATPPSPTIPISTATAAATTAGLIPFCPAHPALSGDVPRSLNRLVGLAKL